MPSSPALYALPPAPLDAHALSSRCAQVRRQTQALAEPLSDADATAQSMPDASPAKWHLAHTTWFFEVLVLERFAPGYRSFDPAWHRLFNSYYETLGERHPRPQRGLLTRPGLDEIRAYRRHVDTALLRLLDGPLDDTARALIELGCHHEQQHQELLLTDLLHLFAQNPLHPVYRPAAPQPAGAPTPLDYQAFEGGLCELGHAGRGFAFDCEGPRHRVFLQPFRLATRPVCNQVWLDFIRDGGYRQPLLWLSAGWDAVRQQGWSRPEYWQPGDGAPQAMTLAGLQALDPAAPVCHISYYEADAFARWAGARLPTEFEWEFAAREQDPGTGHFSDSGLLQPRAASGAGLRQLFGDVWEWTRSAFSAYPGFRPAAGAAGEYNGKFMSGAYVLRGGSCASPAGHLRASYRNFFHPQARWQFAGLRLAQDL